MAKRKRKGINIHTKAIGCGTHMVQPNHQGEWDVDAFKVLEERGWVKALRATRKEVKEDAGTESDTDI